MDRNSVASDGTSPAGVREPYTSLLLNRVFIVRWWGPPNTAILKRLKDEVKAARERSTDKLFFLAIIPENEGGSSPAMRNELRDFNEGLLQYCVEIHLALQARGMKNAIIRSVATSFLNDRIKIAVHNTLPDALGAIEHASRQPGEPILRKLRALQLVE